MPKAVFDNPQRGQLSLRLAVPDIRANRRAIIVSKRGQTERRPYIYDSAFAILTSPALISATCVCKRSSTNCPSRVPIAVPQPAHRNNDTAPCSPRGVTRPRSKVCPSHLAQAVITIVLIPIRIKAKKRRLLSEKTAGHDFEHGTTVVVPSRSPKQVSG